MIIDDAKVQRVFDAITKRYHNWDTANTDEDAQWLFERLTWEIGILVELGVEPNKKYPWAQWYYVVKNQTEGKEDRYAMPDLPPMDGG